jgi:two-component system cell cycle response regulator
MGGPTVSVLIADLDHFKRINDVYGHNVGDEVLREFARRLRDNIRPMDLPCRWGGEEFVVIMPDTPLQQAVSAGERLRQIVSETAFATTEGELRVTMSGGVAVSGGSQDAVESIVKRADDALYRAKSAGRNKVLVGADGVERSPQQGDA